MVFSKPAWEDFELEDGFGDVLQDICDAEDISREVFVERARGQYVCGPIESAVSLAIIRHLRVRSGRQPVVRASWN
jgi:hypothetical protein